MNLTLVTGASGFVGSILMKQLAQQGMPTIGVSRTPTDGVFTVPTYGSEMDWSPLLVGVKTVIHVAARVHVMRDRSLDPLSDFRKANVDATLHLARAAVRAGVKRFVFISTIKVNGEATEPGRPFRAEDRPNPQGPYAISKFEAECALLEIGRSTGIEIVIIRPPMIYGPGVKGNLASLARWGKFRLPSPLGSVRNARTLVHVSNLCNAIIAACNRAEAANEVFLIADGTSVSTNDIMLKLGWSKTPKTLEFAFSWIVLGILRQRKSTWRKLASNLEVDIVKAQSLLGWEPQCFNSFT